MFNLLFKICSVLIVVFLSTSNPWPVFAKESLLDYLNTLAPADRRNGIFSPSASVTLVTFEDYQCEACAHTHKLLKELMRLYPGRLNFVFRHYPLVDQHPNAMKAALAVEAAAKQGKFWEMHSKLLENQSEWVNLPDPTDDLEQYGRLFGPLTLPDPFDKAFEEYTATIKRDEADAKKLDVKGVPTTFVNGRNVGYITDIDVISKEIEKDMLQGFFKFYNKTTGKEEDSIPQNGTFEIIVASGNTSIDKTAVDVTTKLPIKITYESEGVTREQIIPNDPNKACRGPDGCSITGPIDLPGDPNNWRITAYDPSGQEIAIYNGGAGSPDPLWNWTLLEKRWSEQEEKNPFDLKNPQFIFAILFLLLLIPTARWIMLRKR